MDKSLEQNEEEIWKDIKGYEGLYQVSNIGRVKEKQLTVTCGNILMNKSYLYYR